MRNKTPLYDVHCSLGAKMVDFHGWVMPIQYSGILDEHNCVRNNAGIFDISHMGEFKVTGKQSKEFLNYVLCADITKLQNNGDIIYTGILNENGGFIDDLLLYRINFDDFMLVVNSSNKDIDIDWLKMQSKNFDVSLEDKSMEIGLTALQGPKSIDILESVFSKSFDNLYYYNFTKEDLNGKKIILSRTGYTGEDGFEIYSDWNDQKDIWNTLYNVGQEFGLKPIGLGARDTLRLEAKFPLHGNDINDKITPLQAGLSWIIGFNKDSFIGKSAITKQKEEGTAKRLIAFEMIDRGIPRQGYDILSGDDVIGKVTSGTMSPVLSIGIGMGYIKKISSDDNLFVSVHGRNKRIKIKKGSFVPTRSYKKQ